MDPNEMDLCDECADPDAEDVQFFPAEPCDDDCLLGCNHPTEAATLCKDCRESDHGAIDRAVRRAESGYCE